MAIQTWLILTQSEADGARALSTADFGVQPRLIDNPRADGLGRGPLGGRFVLPARILVDPDFAPIWGEGLGGLPQATMDSADLFLPPSDDAP
jgi:hypothetical protein